MQRRFKIKRRIPDGIQPHVGSQWWCLSNATLKAILNDPRRAEFDGYFKQCWIPDEGYVPSLVRMHSTDLVSTSLTLSRFDDQGKPHLFYDDHGDLLEQSDQFFARKIWHGADGLYRRFLHNKRRGGNRRIATDLGLEHLFEDARERRCNGRKGRLSVGRFPATAHERQPSSCQTYTVLIDFSHVFEGFQAWLDVATGGVTHGRLFKHNAVQFAKTSPEVIGAIPANPVVRDVNPEQFLCNLLWNGRSQNQTFMLETCDSERMLQFVVNDPNAKIISLGGGWILDLYSRQPLAKSVLKRQARRLEKIEKRFLKELKKTKRKDVQFLKLKSLHNAPNQTLQTLVDTIYPNADIVGSLPELRDYSKLRQFVKNLAHSGLNVPVLGDLDYYLPGEPKDKPHSQSIVALG